MVVYGAKVEAAPRGAEAAPASAAAAAPGAGAARTSTVLWRDGDPTPDAALVRRWQEAAMLHGDLNAQFNVGFAFCVGWAPAEKSAKKGVAWLHKAAEAGHAVAQTQLGVCYENGTGVAKDAALAVSWFSKAAAQGPL
jgi:TPR repeat protein